MSTTDIPARLDFARQAALEAGRSTLRYFNRGNYEVELKSDASPVTVADRQAEQLLRDRIATAFPHDAILGEEFGEREGSSGYRWVLDPIDGTKSFISGVPMYGTMIGVEHQGRAVVGVVYIPGTDELIYAGVGQGAWYEAQGSNRVAARVSRRTALSDAVFVTTAVKSFLEMDRGEAYRLLEERTRIARTWGDCYGYLLVATGRADVMVDPVMNIWDAAALQPILEEAGGTFTDWRGQHTIYSGEGIATNGAVLEEVLAITRPFAK